MFTPRFETVVGAVDGSNTLFRVSVGYVPRTLAVLMDGVLGDPLTWVESSPHTGRFRISPAPSLGLLVQAFFLDTASPMPGQELQPMKGTLVPLAALAGRLREAQPLVGRLGAE